MSWKIREGLRDILSKETGYYIHPHGNRLGVALLYPNSYFVGMSNLGIHIIYKLLNQRGDISCERCFLPEKKQQEAYIKTKTPLLTIETQRPINDFDIVAFAISFEMDYFNVLRMLELGKIKLLASERDEMAPIVIAGGPCATFNPEPMSAFIDIFVIGEGEAILPALMDRINQKRQDGLSRSEIIEAVADLPGVYVPRCYKVSYSEGGLVESISPEENSIAPASVSRQWLRDLDEFLGETCIYTENTEFNLHLVEIARGCGRHCRFCMAGYCFRRPRNRSLETIEKMLIKAKELGRRVGLMGAAISDYPEIDNLCRSILGEGLSMSVASFRADSVTQELVDSLAASGLKTLTMAPEAGSERMRAVVNKGIEEHHLLDAMSMGIKAGIRNFRLYIMIGLPGESQEDIEAIAEMAMRLKNFMEANGSRGRLTLSINPFIPKPFTPFQWAPMASLKYIQNAIRYITAAVKRCHNIEIIAESPRDAYIQGILARGDRTVGELIHTAYLAGGSKAFKGVLKSKGLSMDEILGRKRSFDELLPWEHLDMGFAKEYLIREMQEAMKEHPAHTIQCFDNCHRCGVCK